MDARQECAERYRECYVLTKRSYVLCQTLADRAWEREDDAAYAARQDEARQLWAQAKSWAAKWKAAGGQTIAPVTPEITAALLIHDERSNTPREAWEGCPPLHYDRTFRGDKPHVTTSTNLPRQSTPRPQPRPDTSGPEWQGVVILADHRCTDYAC